MASRLGTKSVLLLWTRYIVICIVSAKSVVYNVKKKLSIKSQILLDKKTFTLTTVMIQFC